MLTAARSLLALLADLRHAWEDWRADRRGDG